MNTLLHSGAAALALLLLTAPLAQAQQAPSEKPTTKTKVKTKGAKQAAAEPLTTATPPMPPAGGPHQHRPGQGGPGRPGGPDGPDGPRPKAGSVQALSDFSGTLGEYTADNDDKLYDGFTLKTSTGTEAVRFPRHLAQALMAAAKPGATVTISGFRNADRDGRSGLHLVSLAAGGQTIRDQRPTPPTTPPAETATTVSGTVRSLSQDPRGRTNAIVVSDGTILRLPPAAVEQLAEKLKVGAAVAATGTLRAARPGEVAAQPVKAVRVETITLDGVKFLVR